MKFFLSFFTALLLPLALLADCPKCKRVRGFGLATLPENAFDKEDIGRVTGKVLSIEEIEGERGLVSSTYILMDCDGERVAARLAPEKTLRAKRLSLEPYDRVTVEGSKVENGGATGYIATKVITKRRTVPLRNKDGKKSW